MALTNNIITICLWCTQGKKQKQKTLHYNNLCTRLLYQHQMISERTTAAKMLRKKYPKADTQLDFKKSKHLNS